MLTTLFGFWDNVQTLVRGGRGWWKQECWDCYPQILYIFDGLNDLLECCDNSEFIT